MRLDLEGRFVMNDGLADFPLLDVNARHLNCNGTLLGLISSSPFVLLEGRVKIAAGEQDFSHSDSRGDSIGRQVEYLSYWLRALSRLAGLCRRPWRVANADSVSWMLLDVVFEIADGFVVSALLVQWLRRARFPP